MLKRDETKRRQALELRLAGLSYAQIGKQLGVSRQRIQAMIAPPKEIRNYIVKIASGLCTSCGIKVSNSGHVHHVDNLDETYNDINNLTLLCPGCHRLAHNVIPGQPNGKRIAILLRLNNSLSDAIKQAAKLNNQSVNQWVIEQLQASINS